jgi:quercetin dioxygenase-like cupin family protein
MIMHPKIVSFGNLNGAIYDAQEGDVLPMHDHGPSDIHITIVARGSFRAHGDGWDRIVKAGDVIDWAVGERHELIALEPNSRFVNIVKG